MRNSINGDFELTEEAWVLSMLRRKSGDHAFLIIEGVDENKRRVTIRAELGYKKSGEIIDERYYNIYLAPDVDSNWLIEKTTTKEYYYRSFSISKDQKIDLLEKIKSEVQLSHEKDLIYVKFGNKQAFVGGFWGASLEASGGTFVKNASVEANHASFGASKNASAQMVHHSLDASLQKGHSCVSWAAEKVKETCPEYDFTLLGKIFVMVPQTELPNNEKNQHETTCLIV